MLTIAITIYALSAIISLLFIIHMVHRDLSKGRASFGLLVAVGCITLTICAIPLLNTVLAASFVADFIHPTE